MIKRKARATAAFVRAAWSAAPVAKRLHWLLRLGVATEFIGHGWAGWQGQRDWLPYYALFGISPHTATELVMYVVGALDIIVGLFALIRPIRAVLLYATLWAVFTALLRPLAGESWWEVVERAGNYAAPLALLFLVGFGGRSARAWFTTGRLPTHPSDPGYFGVHWVARFGLALLLIGHGGLAAFEQEPYWYRFFAFFGADSNAVYSGHLMYVVGGFEALLGLAVLIRPARPLLWFALAWKLATESLRPLVGQEFSAFVGRGADFALPLVLLVGAAAYAAARDWRPER
ncbi:hypothetical protein [Saccharothrix obliqua]|uniref:hypothetical protein n=1 Tax=Saccharothrix obliqua TaxID=2861747 RepID=UPI001C5D030F|nr:hypothetical protein [Saccharothrix obliqua]MBW4721926.1 hypothetical protein [Saccharothrix obliqua]